MVSFDTGQYSVPHLLAGETVWVRRHGEQVVIVALGAGGPVEVARHAQTTPGSPRVDDAHFPPAPAGALARAPRPRTSSEAAFLGLGDGAALWLTEAAATGAARVRAKMAEAVELGRLHGDAVVDRALGQAGTAGRFPAVRDAHRTRRARQIQLPPVTASLGGRAGAPYGGGGQHPATPRGRADRPRAEHPGGHERLVGALFLIFCNVPFS